LTRLGFRPRPSWGDHSAPQTPWLNLRGLLLRGGTREGRGKGKGERDKDGQRMREWERREERKGRRGERREEEGRGKVCLLLNGGLVTPLVPPPRQILGYAYDCFILLHL